MTQKTYKVYVNHKNIEDNLNGLNLKFKQNANNIDKDTIMIVIQYPAETEEKDYLNIEPVIAMAERHDVPVIVLDENFDPQHSKDVWLKKNVISYLALTGQENAVWNEIKRQISTRTKHKRRITEIANAEKLEIGSSVTISPQDFEDQKLISLFMGKMGEFMIELKYLLDAIIIKPEEINSSFDIRKIDLIKALEFKWALNQNSETWNFQGRTYNKKNMEQFFKDGDNAAELFKKPEKISQQNHIIIEGESGTGKTLIAKFIHEYVYSNKEHNVAFKHVNCGNLGEKILETQLFGSIKGAYTDAKTSSGAILEAYNGTAFLDEIGEIPLVLQAKLLNYLDTQNIQPTGWFGDPIHVPSLIVAATNRNLQEEVKKGNFRLDLHHLLGFTVTIPPLRERVADLYYLVDFVLQNPGINPVKRKKHMVTHIERSAIDEQLRPYQFPGNFRELEQILQRAVITAKKRGIDIITEDNIKEQLT